MNFKSNFKQYKDDFLNHLKNKQWLELSDFKSLFPDKSIFIIKGKKGIGKSYAMFKEMEQIAKSNKKFVMLRITDAEVKNLSRQITGDPNIPFTIKSGRF